jgi:flagellar hook protein FlgE
MGFQQALSGLNAASQNLDAIGNSIANASTVGFKIGQAQFADVYASSLAGGSGTQIGIGTRLAAVSPEFTQGNIQTTGNPLDMAINGSGFFRMSTGGVITYTRDGEFSLDKNGFIVGNSGAKVTGYPADASGNISSAPPQPLMLTLAPLAPKPTSAASLSLNLNANGAVPANAFSMTDTSTFDSSTSMTVYDSQGNGQTLTTYYVKTAADAWDVYASTTPPSGTPTVLNGGAKIGSLAFNASGALAADVNMNVSIPIASGATNPLAFTLTYPAASTSQYGVGFAVSKNSQDGYTTGQLAGYAIASDGTISGQYTNGQTRVEGQVALAGFINPQGLVAQGNNQWSESSASGQPVVGAPGVGNNGLVQSGALEQSNTDVTQQLVDMITAQRVYQANAETVKTEDQVQQTLLNLR